MQANRNETACDGPASQLRPRGQVLILCPGGLEHGGGIGRQMGYFLHASGDAEIAPIYRLVDSRGPWYLGSSPWHAALAVGYLAAAGAVLVVTRLSSTPALAHINITGRGSTLRKIVLATLARAIGLRYLLHVHDYDYAAEYYRHGSVMKFLIRSIFAGARHVLVLGGDARDALSTALQLPAEQISVLHNAVPDPPAAPPRVAGDGACNVLFLGHLSERKGVPELLRALASPALRNMTWRATLAGGGPVAAYQRVANELGIADRVTFPGWLDQAAVGALCGTSDVLVLPSYAEGLAMSVLEGLSHGLALVATPVGAHKEVIEEGISGLLVPPGNVEALAAALRRVIGDGVLRQTLQEGARSRFLSGFEINSYARRLNRIHAALLCGSTLILPQDATAEPATLGPAGAATSTQEAD